METKTYGKFGDDFDYYTVEEEAHFGGECVGGVEILRTAHFEDGVTELVRQALADEDNLPDTREEYDWGICYVWVDEGARVLLSITGRTE